MIYLDANIFVLSVENIDMLGEKARALLKNVQEGKERAATSVLTFDEVVWKVFKLKGFDEALIAARNLLEMPNLILLDVNTNIISKSLDLMRIYKLYPRDSIHAASALNNNIFTIVSEDKDFNAIKELKRKNINELRL